jgi:tetratricopeptide (TPR) repeat protein
MSTRNGMSSLLSLLLLASPQGAAFTEADMHAMLAEIYAVAPQNANYVYPIEARYMDDPMVNAWTFLRVRDEDQALIPQLELFRGIVEQAKGDRDVIRAILAHEVAHIVMGHSLEGFGLRDLQNHHSRFQEQEADRVGTEFLTALGHGPEDMIQVMLMLDEYTRSHHAPWLDVVGSDHTSPIARAAALSGDQGIYEAVRMHEIGLALMECRNWQAAIAFFDEAHAMEPRLHEAALNAASAALQYYYDKLPLAVQDEWLRPEFGPVLTDTNLIAGRGIAFSEDDHARYADALLRIQAVPETLYPKMKSFLLGTALVLAPQDEEKGLRQGVKELERLLAAAPRADEWSFDLWRLSCANNAALGLERLGEGARGLQILLAEQRADMKYLPSAAENLARLPFDGLTKDDAVAAINVLVHFLNWTPPGAPGNTVAARALSMLTRKHGFQDIAAPAARPIALCKAAVMVIHGKEIPLFDLVGTVTQAFGAIPSAGVVNERFPKLRFLLWGDDMSVVGIAEGDVLLKLTSYVPGSHLELRPKRDTGLQTALRVSVGMSEADLNALLAPAGGAALGAEMVYLLSRRSFGGPDGAPAEEENWTYFPTLNFGVLIENGVVTGISVTPIA